MAATSLDRALRSILARFPTATSVSVCNSFGLVILRVTKGEFLTSQAVDNDSVNLAANEQAGDFAVRFGVTADALDKLSLGSCKSTIARLESSTVVQAALFPLVLNVELDSDAPTSVLELDEVVALLLPTLVSVLEPLRAEAEAQTG